MVCGTNYQIQKLETARGGLSPTITKTPTGPGSVGVFLSMRESCEHRIYLQYSKIRSIFDIQGGEMDGCIDKRTKSGFNENTSTLEEFKDWIRMECQPDGFID